MVADIIDITRALTTDPENRVPHLAFQPDELSDLPVLDMEQVETAYYLRLTVMDKPGVLAQITGIMGEAGISIEALKQQEPEPGETSASLVMLTHRVQEGQMNKAIRAIEEMDSIQGSVARIRVEYLD